MSSVESSAKTSAKTSEGKAAEVERLIAPSIEAMGYDIVRVQLSGGDWLRLQIMAERRTDGGMDVDDCAEVSRAVAAILDVEDPRSEEHTSELQTLMRPSYAVFCFDKKHMKTTQKPPTNP